MLPQKNGNVVNLAGQNGTASFVKIFRNGGIEDYGYYASSRGEPGNELAPAINVYVIRNSSYARDQEIIGLEEFVKLAEVIEASLALKR